MDRCVDKSGHVIILGEFENNKKYKEQILKEITAAMCALLNTNGGKVMIRFETDPKIPVEGSPFSNVSSVIRILEQSMISIIGLNQTVSKIQFIEDKESKILVIKKSDSLIPTNYNLYLPSQKQVVQVYSWEPPQKVMEDIIARKIVEEPVQRDSHYKNFRKGRRCGFYESKISQLKNLKAEQSKRTRLTDRMTGKGNKFICYVSAFANYRGGHVYYGIKDDGIVEGEEISNDDISDITKKVEKAINKLMWPEETSQPKRGEHWEIFFEPVLDENFKPIPSTFVIVIYIAPCLGGVFTEEPECYELVEKKVQKVSFGNWKKRMIQPVCLRGKEEISSSVQRTKWSSAAAHKDFTIRGEKLRQLIGNGRWKAFDKECEYLESKSESHDVKLLVLSQKVRANFRRGEFSKASEHLKHYEEILPKARDRSFFEVIGFYLRAALYRATGNFKRLKEFLAKALASAELIEPGLVTATVYTFAGTVTDWIDSVDSTEKVSPDILSLKAREHLQRAPDHSEVLGDMERKLDMTLATFYLGFNINGQHLQDEIDSSRLEKAKGHIRAIDESVREGHPLKTYFDTQRNLVLAIYKYRQSQAHSASERTRLLRNAFSCAEKAERLARDSEFTEMVRWSLTFKGMCTEELVRTKLTKPK